MKKWQRAKYDVGLVKFVPTSIPLLEYEGMGESVTQVRIQRISDGSCWVSIWGSDDYGIRRRFDNWQDARKVFNSITSVVKTRVPVGFEVDR